MFGHESRGKALRMDITHLQFKSGNAVVTNTIEARAGCSGLLVSGNSVARVLLVARRQ